MTKDPAVLLYIDKWLVATKSMPPEARGWYLNLILTQYDRGGELPNDIEELAVICDVKFSDYDRFKSIWEQVLKQKFKQNESGTIYNELSFEILKGRESFKKKREDAGSIGFIVKIAREFGYTAEEIENLKNWQEISTLFKKDKQELKHLLKQIRKLFINVDVNKDTDTNQVDNKMVWFDDFWNRFDKKTEKTDAIRQWEKLTDAEINLALDAVDLYIASTPDKNYRKAAHRWLQKKCWNDEVIMPTLTAKTKSGQALRTDLLAGIEYDEHGNMITQ